MQEIPSKVEEATMGKPGLYILLLLSLCWVCAARIEHATIDRDSRQLIPLSNSFGFGAEGHLGITVSHILVHAVAKPNLSDFGFFLTTTPNDLIEMLQIDPSVCFLRETTDYNVEVLATFMSPGLVTLVNNGTGSYENSTAIGPGRGGEYSLFFENCADVDSVVVSFKVRTEMYNVNAAGKRDYLSAGEAELPTVFLMMALLFTLAAAGWAYLVWIERANAQKIHYLMFLLVVLKILTLFSQAAMYHYIRMKGTPDGWNIAFYIFTFLRGIMFFSVVVLIGTGWSYMKPFLGDHEKKILMVVIPLQVFANVAIIILDENTPADRTWLTWLDIFHLVDIICCCAVLFPIVWSIKHLREAAQTDGKAARNMMKLTLFRHFYVMVVIYIYFTRIVVFLLRSTLPYKYTWLSFAANELATLVFYVLTALKFKPHKENPYLKIEAEEDEGQEML